MSRRWSIGVLAIAHGEPAEQRARLEALAARAPKVVSLSPPSGGEDVDAASVTAITITFDRPMRELNYAFVPVPQTKVPAVKAPLVYRFRTRK